MEKKYPRFRITVELLDPGSRNVDSRVAIYAYDRGRVAGDVWLNEMTRSYSVELEAGEIILGVGHEAGAIRSAAQMIELERSKK